MKNAKLFILLAILIQFGILGWMIFHNSRPYRLGRVVTVETVPVDPRDLFRGDYVTLRYEFNNVSSHFPAGSFCADRDAKRGLPVYAILTRPATDGSAWKLEKVTFQKPTVAEMGENRVFIAGIVARWDFRYGIEQLFVQEGKGKELEKAMFRTRTSEEDKTSVLVDLYVTPDGQAAVKEARIVQL